LFLMADTQPKRLFDLSGGNLALNFVNTVSHRPASQPIERLPDHRSLVAFGDESEVFPPRVVDRLYAIAAEAPGRGKTALQGAIQLREALFVIFSAVAERRAIPGNALALLNLALQTASAHGRVLHTGRRFQWEWSGMDSALDSVLWPIARAAADLLLSDDIANVRVCASDACAWLFLDTTKNHRRRWCDMKTCGNRVKARRHYERVKAG
jgi:predicted RNA-binding Zn ribbon-like protein